LIKKSIANFETASPSLSGKAFKKSSLNSGALSLDGSFIKKFTMIILPIFHQRISQLTSACD